MTIDRTQGGGPWTFSNDEPLAPGDHYQFNFERDEKGRYRDWAPMDSAIVKNFDTGNRISVIWNGQFEYVVDPNGVDSFNRAGINRFRVVNDGSGTIDAGDVLVSVSVEPYGDDDRALERKQRNPLEKIFGNALGL